MFLGALLPSLFRAHFLTGGNLLQGLELLSGVQ